jgi:hypothetical protein
MFIMTRKPSYQIKSNIILYMWQMWHSCRIVQINPNMTHCDCNVTFDDVVTSKLKKKKQLKYLKIVETNI